MKKSSLQNQTAIGEINKEGTKVYILDESKVKFANLKHLRIDMLVF